jgi:hypothetical protein
MLKLSAYLLIILVAFVLITFVLAKPKLRNVSENKPVKKQLVLHRQGQAVVLDDQSPYFKNVVEECQQLFAGADSSPRLIMSGDRIDRIKKKQTAVELILPRTQTVTLKNQQTVYYTKLLIPLTDEFSNGTVFFAGTYEQPLGGKTPEYSSLLEYGAINFVRNSQGLHKLKESLRSMGVMTN